MVYDDKKSVEKNVKDFIASFNRVQSRVVTLPTYHLDPKTEALVKEVLDEEGIKYKYIVEGDGCGFNLYLNQSPEPTDDEKLVMMLCPSPDEFAGAVVIEPDKDDNVYIEYKQDTLCPCI